MNRRDLILLIAGIFLVVIGIGAALYGNLSVAIILLLLVCALILSILLLQRRQLATVQKRTLQILRSQNELPVELAKTKLSANSDLSTKKIIGLLSAQQISMEKLDRKLEDSIRQRQSNG